jgi:DNA (cytosine-5)-methyltransferase 1
MGVLYLSRIVGDNINDADFHIGKHIKYEIDQINNKITVVMTNEATNNRVAQTTVRSGKIVPVIDIKTKEVKEFFEKNSNVEVSIYKGRIIFTVKQVISTKIIQFKKKSYSIAMPVGTFAKAVGWDQTSIFDLFNLSSTENNCSEIKDELNNKVAKTLKLLSLFSGIGAFEKALTRQFISYEVVNYCEIDKFASKAYSIIHNIPESLNLWDVKNVSKTNFQEPIDAMTWGFPCTDLSSSGKQKGFIDEQGNLTRSGLYYEGIRIIREIKPKYSIIENVKALISSKFNKEFTMILDDLKDAGYNSYWTCYNASDFGVAQHRERVVIISVRKDIDTNTFSFSHTAEEPVRLKDCLETKNIDTSYYVKQSVLDKFKEKIVIKNKTRIITVGQVSSSNSQGGKVYSIYGVFPTLCACTHGYALGYIQVDNLIRQLMPIECARLMGFDDIDIYKCKKAKISDTQLYKMLGNSIVVYILESFSKKLFIDYRKDSEDYCLV